MRERLDRIRRIQKIRSRRTKSIVAITASGVLVFILIVLMVLCDYSYNENRWNNGYCPCGGEWHFRAVESASTSTASSKYWYECDNCRALMYQSRAR